MSEILIFVSGYLRPLPYVIWAGLEGPKPEDPSAFIGNGCTMSPDYVLGKRAWPACVVHDYQYNFTDLSRKAADRIFRHNLKFCLKADGMLGFLASGVSWVYYRAVRKAGKRFYNSTGDNA